MYIDYVNVYAYKHDCSFLCRIRILFFTDNVNVIEQHKGDARHS